MDQAACKEYSAFMKHFLRVTLLLALALVCVEAIACPGCKEAMMSPDGKPTISLTAQGFGWSIIFMLSTVLSLISLVVYKVRGIIVAEEARLQQKS